MAYSFRPGEETVAEGTRRIALSQLDKGLAELDDEDLDLSGKVHQFRKRCKKIRGLVRLVRPVFSSYGDENETFRDVARSLSDIRDADATLETLNRLRDRFGGQVKKPTFDALHRVFAAERHDVHASEDPHSRLDKAGLVFSSARNRVQGWMLEADGFEAIAGGMKKTYGRAFEAFEAAIDDPSDEALHEWRKRVKYHWYHARLLKRIAPDLMRPHCELADRLADNLGDRQDLAVVRPRLDELTGDVALRDLSAMRGLIVERQAELEHTAFSQGRLLLADRPKALKRRWRSWWDAARSQCQQEGVVSA